jgi:hypothetical protein
MVDHALVASRHIYPIDVADDPKKVHPEPVKLVIHVGDKRKIRL